MHREREPATSGRRGIVSTCGTQSQGCSSADDGQVSDWVCSIFRDWRTHGRALTGICRWKDKSKDKVIDTRPFSQLVEKSTDIFSHKWPSFVGGGPHDQFNKETVLSPGNYEWPFELMMNGSMAETIEGLTNSHITYKLEATVMRGKLGHNMHVSKPVRIVRTPDPTLLELGHPVTVEDVWSNKIDYQFRIPQRAFAFGTAIPIEMRFTPLLKGLRMGTISCVLYESQEFTPPEATANTERSSTRQRDVDSWEFELNNDEHHILDENGQDCYALGKMLPLPKLFRRCVQDADVCGIKIRHSVKCRLALHNPDGHISEVCSFIIALSS